jgi:translation initiation factor IF-1
MTNHTTDNPFSAGDTVTIRVQDWERGEILLKGRVTRILSAARCQVQVEDRRYSVPVEDMELGCADTIQRARAA